MDWQAEEIRDLVTRALKEDLGAGDVSVAATIPAGTVGHARIVAKQDMVCAGLPLVEMVFRTLDTGIKIEFKAHDGDAVKSGADLVRLEGAGGAILTGERTALNFLGQLSGVATLTRKFVEQLAGTRAKIRDTRKTTPGMRLLEKYAVKMGGGSNHRIGLFDAILLKENHIALAGGVKSALDQAHSFASRHMKPRACSAYEAVGSGPAPEDGKLLTVQIEVRNEEELREAIGAGAEAVLLDNMSPDEARRCVGIAKSMRADCIVEVSGGITLQNARAYAETGADYLSSGALTHSAPAADVSLLVDSLRAK